MAPPTQTPNASLTEAGLYRKPRTGFPLRGPTEPDIFALELGIQNVVGTAYVGPEEIVIATANGCEFVSNRQETLPRFAGALVPKANRSR